jgi:uncharacterized protein YidB (DUF937 family)
MTSIFDAITGALNEAMQQQKPPVQQPQAQPQPQSQQPMPGQPGGVSYSSGPSFMEILEGSGLGNLEGLVKQLTSGGLDQHVQSWLGNGENMPVNTDQLRGAIGDQHVQNMGQQAGVSAESILKILAQYLPAAIDQASPNGKIQDPSRATH